MNRPIFKAGLLAVLGALAPGMLGCQQAQKATPVTKASKPDDPTAWSDKDLAKGTSDSGAGNSGLPQGSGYKGTWSREAQDIERSLGVGK